MFLKYVYTILRLSEYKLSKMRLVIAPKLHKNEYQPVLNNIHSIILALLCHGREYDYVAVTVKFDGECFGDEQACDTLLREHEVVPSSVVHPTCDVGVVPSSVVCPTCDVEGTFSVDFKLYQAPWCVNV